jgi:hypothetical protein
LVQSIVVAVDVVVVLTAPPVFAPAWAAAVLQAALFAFPAFVQSYWRVVVVVLVAVVVIFATAAVGLALTTGVLAAPLQAALVALPGFEQS